MIPSRALAAAMFVVCAACAPTQRTATAPAAIPAPAQEAPAQATPTPEAPLPTQWIALGLRDFVEQLAMTDAYASPERSRAQLFERQRAWLDEVHNDVDPRALEAARAYLDGLERTFESAPRLDAESRVSDARLSMERFAAVTRLELAHRGMPETTRREMVALLPGPEFLEQTLTGTAQERATTLARAAVLQCGDRSMPSPVCVEIIGRCMEQELAAEHVGACGLALRAVRDTANRPMCEAGEMGELRIVSTPPGRDFTRAEIARLEAADATRTRVLLARVATYTGYRWRILIDGVEARGASATASGSGAPSPYALVEPGVLVIDLPIDRLCRTVTRPAPSPRIDALVEAARVRSAR